MYYIFLIITAAAAYNYKQLFNWTFDDIVGKKIENYYNKTTYDQATKNFRFFPDSRAVADMMISRGLIRGDIKVKSDVVASSSLKQLQDSPQLLINVTYNLDTGKYATLDDVKEILFVK